MGHVLYVNHSTPLGLEFVKFRLVECVNFTMTVGTKHEAFICFGCYAFPSALEAFLRHLKFFLGWVVVVEVIDVGVVYTAASLTSPTLMRN